MPKSGASLASGSSEHTLAWTLQLFEKEKGGVGSTGTLMSVAHELINRGEQLVFIECSISQHDVLNAYEKKYRVEQIFLGDGDARDRIISTVATSPPGAHILVNVPGNNLQHLDAIHEMVQHIIDRGRMPIECKVTWTMGREAASRSTLDAVLATSPPGQILLNLPKWNGEPADFKWVDDELVQSITDRGGKVYQMPALKDHLYDQFQTYHVSPDRMVKESGLSFGNEIALEMWEDSISHALKGIY